MAGLYAPLPTLRRRPRGRLRTDRGRRGLLILHRSGLSPHTPCQSPGALTRVAACTLALSPICDTLIEGFSHFVASMTAPIASGWSGCRVGFAPTGKRRLVTAHTRSGLRARSLSKLDRVPFPHSLPGRKVLVLSIAEGLALGLWGRLMLRREFIILGGGVAVLPRAARAQLAIPVIGFLGSALQSVSNYLAAFRNRIRTLPSLLEGTPCTPLSTVLPRWPPAPCSPPAPLPRAPEASFFTSHRPLPTSFGTSMVRAGRHGRVNRTRPFGEKW